MLKQLNKAAVGGMYWPEGPAVNRVTPEHINLHATYTNLTLSLHLENDLTPSILQPQSQFLEKQN